MSKSRVACFSVCGLYNKQACLNASSYLKDLNKESECASEILKALQPNVTDNENNDNVLEIQCG